MAKTVLVVDDSKSIVTLVELTLREAGYEVITAYDGQNALDAIEQGARPDLIICDLNMPRIDGLSLLKAVKDMKDLRFTPFLMLTTESQEKMREAAKDAGARAWIIKPFTAEQLLSAVKKLVR